MRKLILIGLCLLALAALVFGLLRLQTRSVEIQAVERGTAIDAVPATVEVQHASVVTLSGEEGGRILESNLRLGEHVEEGEALLRIDPAELELEAEALRDRIQHLEQRSRLRMQRKIDLARAKEELQNNERLYEAGNYPELEIIRRRREFQAFRENQLRQKLDEAQQLENLRHQLKRVELRLAHCTVHAPASGTINRIFAFEGEVIHPRSQIAHIHSDQLLISARINEEDFAGVRKGLDATVRLLTYGNRLFPGKIASVLPGADPETQQYTVFLDLEIPDELLLAGLSGEASIIRQRKQDALLIPRPALFGNSVFVAKNGRAERRTVEVGARGLNQVEIREGLEPGESIIAFGAAELRDGDRIRPR